MATKEIQQPPAARAKSQPPKAMALKKPLDDAMKFLRGVKHEFNKVSWPSRQELQYNAAVVILVTVLISSYMWGVDWLLAKIFSLLHKG